MWPHTFYIEWTDCQKETPSFIFSAISGSASKSKNSPIGTTPARKTGFVKTHNYAGILAFYIRLFCFNVIQLLSVAGTISNATASPPTAARLGLTPNYILFRLELYPLGYLLSLLVIYALLILYYFTI